MTGFAGVSKRRRDREFDEFPELLEYLRNRFPIAPKSWRGAPEARTEIEYRDLEPIRAETAGFNRVADELGAFSERFMTAPSPGIISTTMLNAYYATHEAYSTPLREGADLASARLWGRPNSSVTAGHPPHPASQSS